MVRTDRCHPYYSGENNSNITVLKDVLLNYAVAHPNLGYTQVSVCASQLSYIIHQSFPTAFTLVAHLPPQGMSDLLAPILAEMKNEVDAYWCFVGLMRRTIFFSTPRDTDMDRQLVGTVFAACREIGK